MSGIRVAVVGGGLAGITAALRCADAGAAVTLFETRPRLGGRTHSFRRGTLSVDNGQHVFLRCCTAYRQLLQRLVVADHVSLQPRLDIAVRAPHQRPVRLRRSNLVAPLHLAGAVLRYAPLSVAERLRFARAAMALRTVAPHDPGTDLRTFGDWLRAHGQSPHAIAALWDLVGVATLNAAADDAALSVAATVFQTGLLTDSAAADIGWPLVPLQQLHGEPAARALAAAGTTMLTRTRIDAIVPHGRAWRLTAGTRQYRFDQVICAVPPTAAERILPAGAVAHEPGWSARLGTSPIINAHLVYDRRVLDEPFIAGVDSPIQWVFDRTDSGGTLPPGGRQYLTISQSAADAYIDLPVAELRDRLLPALEALLPRARHAGLLDFFITRERHATFRPTPGTAGLRADARTPLPGLFLAGAWTATGWPDTMESAARSGQAAAAALLQDAATAPVAPAGAAAGRTTPPDRPVHATPGAAR
jgi:squalene-associated FAD-dependent desaturase